MSSMLPTVSRRRFLHSALASGVWTLGVSALPSVSAQPAAVSAPTPPGFGAWLRFSPDGRVTALTNISDLGQGTQGAIVQIVAEELELPPSAVQIEMAAVRSAFGNRFINGYGTFGSIGYRTAYATLAPVCAAARDMLVRAAAARWSVVASECHAAAGRVLHATSSRSAAYAELLADAAALTPIDKPVLKPRQRWTVLGQSVPRFDIPAKTDGSAVYGIDVRLPGLLVASVLHAPTFGGTLASLDDKPALAVKGVHKVVRLPHAVAVVADGYWPAHKGAQALKPRWRPGPNATLGSAALRDEMRQAAAAGQGRVFPQDMDKRLDAGSTDKALAQAGRVVDITYDVPFLAHATMEPLNATVRINADSAELWLSTQSQSDTQAGVAKALGLSADQVVIHSQTIGGGFGRRLEHDFAIEAALIARAVGQGRPVKTIWSREVDMRAGYYRPAAAARVRLALGADHLPTALRVDMANPSLLEHSRLSNDGGVEGLDSSAGMGWVGHSYAIAALHLTWSRVERGVPCGYWRSVGASQNTFAFECTLDQAARGAGIDPVDYRRRLLAGKPRELAFVDALAARAHWGQPLKAGHFRGFAMGEANRAISGHVVEISLAGPGRFRLERITAAIDAGVVANPNAVEAQVMGGTVFGLSAALFGEITLKNGQVEQGNFDSYRLVTLAQMPPLDVLVLANAERAAGVGEEAVPTIAPAIANALFAASGRAVTRLPLHRAGWQLAG